MVFHTYTSVVDQPMTLWADTNEASKCILTFSPFTQPVYLLTFVYVCTSYNSHKQFFAVKCSKTKFQKTKTD